MHLTLKNPFALLSNNEKQNYLSEYLRIMNIIESKINWIPTNNIEDSYLYTCVGYDTLYKFTMMFVDKLSTKITKDVATYILNFGTDLPSDFDYFEETNFLTNPYLNYLFLEIDGKKKLFVYYNQKYVKIEDFINTLFRTFV